MTPVKGFSRLHFIGLGGAGMSSLAEVMLGFGFEISGSDAKAGPALERLASLGAIAFVGHAADQVGDADAVVFSAAIPADNPEMLAAESKGIPKIRRADLLGKLTAGHRSLLVAGTHGKSTTTAMLGSIYRKAGLDPTLVGGAAAMGEDLSAVAGKGDILIAEADEFDRAFLSLHPSVAVITNVDADHLDCYGTEAALHQAFRTFLESLPPQGLAVIKEGDPVLTGFREELKSRSVSFGFDEKADYRALVSDAGEAFTLVLHGRKVGSISMPVPGDHNILNALAAVAVALEDGLDFDQVARGIAAFAGIKRRLEFLGERQGIRFYDDYAHHPTEVTASLRALRKGLKGRLVAVFQPHLYSRTRDHIQGFAQSLALADAAYVTRIYAAREKPITGIEGDRIVAAAMSGSALSYLEDWEGSARKIAANLRPGDLLVTMGAGDIHRLGPEIMEALS